MLHKTFTKSLNKVSAAIATVAASLSIAIHSNQADAENRPNVVVIVADDLGYGDVKCFGQSRCQIETPSFDRLAQEGVRFTNAYSIASVCIPSRVSMMTGRYAFRFSGAQRGGPWGFVGLQFSPQQPTIASVLKEKGYSTGYVGKWHLGTTMTTVNEMVQGINTVDYTQPLIVGPRDFGFQESFILPGSLDMYPYAFIRNHHWVGDVSTVKGWSAFARMGPADHAFRDKDVLNTIADESIRFIESQDEQPYFLFVGLTAPHTPVTPSDEFLGRSKIGVYGDFVLNTDAIIGRITRAIDQTPNRNNTLVIVTSDHGPASYAGPRRRATASQMKELEQQGHFAAGGFRGYKFSSYEGAFRVPFITRWPQKLPAGCESDQIVGLVDLFSTITEVVLGGPLGNTPAVDSYNFLNSLIGKQNKQQRDSIFLQGSRGNAYRSGPWKLILCPGSGASGHWGNTPPSDSAWNKALQAYGRNPASREELQQYPFLQLYNLDTDPSESTNLANSNPEQVKQMISQARKIISSGHSHPDATPDADAKQIPLFRYVPRAIKVNN